MPMSNLHDASLSLHRYVERYGLKAFIETGCYIGSGLDTANRWQLDLFSCDLNSGHVERCKAMFPNAHVYVTDSSSFLRDVCPYVRKPTLFWLDAHFPRKAADERHRWPLFDDLQAIKQLKPDVERDVILCDDIRVIAGNDNPRYRPGEDDHVNSEHSLREYIAVFADTHDVEIIHEETGVLAFRPRTPAPGGT
jgi:hypothetical protein